MVAQYVDIKGTEEESDGGLNYLAVSLGIGKDLKK